MKRLLHNDTLLFAADDVSLDAMTHAIDTAQPWRTTTGHNALDGTYFRYNWLGATPPTHEERTACIDDPLVRERAVPDGLSRADRIRAIMRLMANASSNAQLEEAADQHLLRFYTDGLTRGDQIRTIMRVLADGATDEHLEEAADKQYFRFYTDALVQAPIPARLCPGCHLAPCPNDGPDRCPDCIERDWLAAINNPDAPMWQRPIS
jgi:hypothetical protein